MSSEMLTTEEIVWCVLALSSTFCAGYQIGSLVSCIKRSSRGTVREKIVPPTAEQLLEADRGMSFRLEETKQ